MTTPSSTPLKPADLDQKTLRQRFEKVESRTQLVEEVQAILNQNGIKQILLNDPDKGDDGKKFTEQAWISARTLRSIMTFHTYLFHNVTHFMGIEVIKTRRQWDKGKPVEEVSQDNLMRAIDLFFEFMEDELNPDSPQRQKRDRLWERLEADKNMEKGTAPIARKIKTAIGSLFKRGRKKR